MSTSLLLSSCRIAGSSPPCFSNANSKTTSQKQKSRLALRAGGCSCFAIANRTSRQGSPGAACGRDDGGVDAPGNSCHRQSIAARSECQSEESNGKNEKSNPQASFLDHS